MEQLKEDLTKIIQSMFDNSLEYTEEGEFDDFEKFEEYYQEFVRWRFNDGQSDIDIDDFTSHFEFSYFDALTIIKEFHEDIGEHFEDYDNKDKIWEFVCYICARDATNEITNDPKYKQYILPPKERFIKKCNEQIKELQEEDDTEFTKKSKLFLKVSIECLEYLKKFDIDNVNKKIHLINLIFQSKMKDFEKAPEQIYINVCKMCKRKYEFILSYKEEAIKIKDL